MARIRMTFDVFEQVFTRIDRYREEMVSFLCDLVRISAIGPRSGGDGELKKAEALEGKLRSWGFENIYHHDAMDEMVPGGYRPNLRLDLKGKTSRERLVIIVHMDVVPPGDLSLWRSDPFSPVVSDGKLTGRGVEDNGQALTAAVFAAKVLKDLDLVPERDISVFFVSDEEETNEKGIGHLLKEGLIRKSDLLLVPDHGEPEGRIIELREKSLLWTKVVVKGKQCHASMPHLGTNAFRASMMFGSRVDIALHERFAGKDESFDHPFSSFEPTKKEPGVGGINILPGEDAFYFDCRLLPVHSRDDVLSEMERVASEVGKETGTTILIETVLSESTLHPTPPDAKIVRSLSNAIRKASKKEPLMGGIGGGTCAAMLRNAGFEVAVWETILNQAHAPNEHILISNMVSDCKVMAVLFMQP
jgi:succinyl-diaminopimelate desuccinylase